MPGRQAELILGFVFVFLFLPPPRKEKGGERKMIIVLFKKNQLVRDPSSKQKLLSYSIFSMCFKTR